MMSTCEVGALAGISLPWSLPGLFPFLKHLVERRAGNEGALPGYGFKALSSLAPSFVYSLLTSHVYLSGTLRLFANCCLRSLMKRVIGTWFPGVFVTRSLWPLSRGPGFQDHSFWSQLYGSTDFDAVPISGTIPLLNPIDPISSGATQVEDVPRLPPSTYGSNPTSSQSRSKTGRRRRRAKKVREPLHNLINHGGQEQPAGGVSSSADPWTRMNGLVQQALTGETSAVCAAAQHANLLLPDAESGSLAWWLCKEVLAASKVFDHTSFLLILRGLETMRKSRPCGSGTLRVTCCNLTTWRREVKQWLVNQGEVLLVQEHHLLGPSLPEEISSMGGLGYDSFLVPACPGEGRHNSSRGGIGIFVKSHLGARFRGQFVKQGCGYVAVTLRRLGADLTVVSLDLQIFLRFRLPCQFRHPCLS